MHTTLRVSLFPSRDIVTFPLSFGCGWKLPCWFNVNVCLFCSELRSAQKASSRVSCNHCCELHFDLSNEASGLHFNHGSKILSVCFSQCYSCCLHCRLSQLFASHGRQLLCQTIRWFQLSPEFLRGRHLFLNRSLLFVIDSRSDLSHRHLVSI